MHQVQPFYFLTVHNGNSMNKMPAKLKQPVHKLAQADLWRTAAAFIPQFQSQQGIPEPVRTVCFSHQFHYIDVPHYELHHVTFETANDEIRVKPAPMGSDFLRDINQELVRLMSRIKETLFDYVCAASIRRNTTHLKRSVCPWMIHPDSRLLTDTTMKIIRWMYIGSPSPQRQMRNT